jgi:hypothetical protein
LAATPMGEYVPPMFRTVAVSGAIQKARAILFGSRPDAAMLDYRLRQYMAMLHATELIEFVTVNDPRITYTPGDRDMADFNPMPSVLPIGHTLPLFISGEQPTAADGRMTYSWQVVIKIASPVDPTTVNVTQRSPISSVAGYAISYTDGLSNEFPLVGSPLLARFHHQGAVDEITWNVNCLAMPTQDPGQIAANFGTLGTDVLGELFGAAAQEPYRTWQNLWKSDQPLPYRLGAVLLAVAARTDEIRMGTS